MSRRVRILAIVLFASFALGTAACSSISGPSGDCTGQNNSETC